MNSEIATAKPAHPRRRVRHRRRAWRWVLIAVPAVVVLLAVWLGLRAYRAYNAYQATARDAAALQALSSADLATLSTSDLTRIQFQLYDAQQHLDSLDRSLQAPLGSASLVDRLPWVGPRYQAARQTLRLGELLTGAGAAAVGVGRDALTGFDTTGIDGTTGRAGGTWLDALSQQQGVMTTVIDQVQQARTIRSEIDPALLPARVQTKLAMVDGVLNRFDPRVLTPDNLTTLQAALGADKPKRYLVMFQNPAELRPSGGFPGTVALVEVSRGQLRSYEFYDVHRLTEDYMALRSSKLPEPWPIDQFFPQDGFLLQDATWYGDFPRSAQLVMQMYAETHWPAIDGIIMVDPAVVQGLLDKLGSVTVEVDGQQQEISAANVMDEIEHQRQVEAQSGQPTHKELLTLIGQQLIVRLKSADRASFKPILQVLLTGAEHRDIQAYSTDPAVEQTLDSQHWSGRLVPDPTVPTIAVTMANVALGKSSLRMIPSYDLTVSEARDGRRDVTLTMTLHNTGTTQEDPFYAGYQHWWVAVQLPDGSVVSSANHGPQPDPEAPNGGSYAIDLYPSHTDELTIHFSMPAGDRLLLRRQPGLQDGIVTEHLPGCSQPRTEQFTADLALALGGQCG